MLTLNTENLLNELFKKFPDFKRKMAYDLDDLLIYNVIGDFATDFQKNYIDSKISECDIEEFFSFINEMANSADIEVKNILVVEIFELFSDEISTINISREKLNNVGKELFEKTLAGWK